MIMLPFFIRKNKVNTCNKAYASLQSIVPKILYHSSCIMSSTESSLAAPDGTTITIIKPDDFHHHFRDGSKTKSVLKHAVKRFTRCIAMPNLKPPVTTTEAATNYYNHIMSSLPADHKDNFEPLMTLYLTDNTTPEEIRKAKDTGFIKACKYYPAGATTNSDFGVTSLSKVYPALKAMEEVGLVLCIHSEVSRSEIDIFDREEVFIQEVMTPLIRDFKNLKIVMEHISTFGAVEYVKNGPENLCASITPHHLLYNRNGMCIVHSIIFYIYTYI